MRSKPGDCDQVNRDRRQIENTHEKQDDNTCLSETGTTIRITLRTGGLLHGHAMEGAETEHQIAAVNADHLARRKQLRERVKRDAVVRVIERWHQHQTVRDVEIR